jgi:hypothetical protein
LIFNLRRVGSVARSSGVSAGVWRGHLLILFGLPSQSSKTKALAAMVDVAAGPPGRLTPPSDGMILAGSGVRVAGATMPGSSFVGPDVAPPGR